MSDLRIECRGKPIDLSHFKWEDKNSNGDPEKEEVTCLSKEASDELLACYRQLVNSTKKHSTTPRASDVKEQLPITKVVAFDVGSLKLNDEYIFSLRARQMLENAFRRYAPHFQTPPEVSIGAGGTDTEASTYLVLSGKRKSDGREIMIRAVGIAPTPGGAIDVEATIKSVEAMAEAIGSKTLDVEGPFQFDNTVCKFYGDEGPQVPNTTPTYIQPGMLATKYGLQCFSVTHSDKP